MKPRQPEVIILKMSQIQIITFYEFKKLEGGELADLRDRLKAAMRENSIKGTIILAEEGFNATVCGPTEKVKPFVREAERCLKTRLKYKSSMHTEMPFRRVDVKIKPEIVTLKRVVDVSAGAETFVDPAKWNEIILDPATFVLDTRNDYEFRTGTFRRAVSPKTEKFSDLPSFVEANLDPEKHKRIAMFCTGGIRCEKLAPFMKQQGFEEVYQLRGGILKYLEEVPAGESLWEGECFVFDDRVSVDHSLKKGDQPDLSQIQKPD